MPQHSPSACCVFWAAQSFRSSFWRRGHYGKLIGIVSRKLDVVGLLQLVTWFRWSGRGTSMTNIYKGQWPDGKLRLEVLHLQFLQFCDSHNSTLSLAGISKKGGESIPFLDENIPYLEDRRGRGGTKCLNQWNWPWVSFKFWGTLWPQAKTLAKIGQY